MPDRSGTSRYYPGEALWALALMHEAFPGEGWDTPAKDALDFVTMRRDDVENVEFPPLADQWAAYGLAEMAEWGLGDEHIDYASRLAARFGLLAHKDDQIDEHDRYAIRAGFWREIDVRTGVEHAPAGER